LCESIAAAASEAPIMPKMQPIVNPARRPRRFMNNDTGNVVSPPPMM
jgi:hypothetical protein